MNKKNVFIIYGPDEFLVELERNKLVNNLKKNEYQERDIFFSKNPSFSYEKLISQQYDDLFSAKKILDFRLENVPSKTEGDLLEELCKNFPTEKTMIISVMGIDRIKSRSWFKKILNYSESIEVKKIWPNQKKQWINNISKRFNISISKSEIDLIIEKTQGNLVAAYQELKMIKALETNSNHSQVLENSNFDIFNLLNSILKGDIKESLKILEYLKLQSGSEALIIWGLYREIERISFLKEDINTKLNGPFDYLENIKEKSEKLSNSQVIYYKKKVASLDSNFKKGNDDFWKKAERVIIEFIRPESLQ